MVSPSVAPGTWAPATRLPTAPLEYHSTAAAVSSTSMPGTLVVRMPNTRVTARPVTAATMSSWWLEFMSTTPPPARAACPRQGFAERPLKPMLQ